MTLNIVRGKVRGPRRIVISGAPGVGKTTWACSGEKVLCLSYEDGVEYLGAARIDAKKDAPTWESTLKLTQEACTSPGDWDTVVVDTVDRVQDLLSAEVVASSKDKSGRQCTSLEEVGGGFGKGAGIVGDRWKELLFVLEKAKGRARSVILVSHIRRQRVNDPALGEFHEWSGGIVKDAWAHTFRWADDVLFAAYEQAPKDGRIYMSGKRLIKTVKGNGYDAKNRLGLPEEILLDWSEYARYMRSDVEVRGAIEALSAGLDAETLGKVKARVALAGDDVSRLCSIERALQKKTERTGESNEQAAK